MTSHYVWYKYKLSKEYINLRTGLILSKGERRLWVVGQSRQTGTDGARLQLILLYNLIIHYNTSCYTLWTRHSSEAFPQPYMAWESFKGQNQLVFEPQEFWQTLCWHSSHMGYLDIIFFMCAESSIFLEWSATGTKVTFSESLFIGHFSYTQ